MIQLMTNPESQVSVSDVDPKPSSIQTSLLTWMDAIAYREMFFDRFGHYPDT